MRPIEKGLPDRGCWHHVAVSKYGHHLSLHRQGVDVPAPRSGVVAQNDARASGRSENTLNCNLPRQTDTVAITPQSRVGNFSGSQYLLHPSPAAGLHFTGKFCIIPQRLLVSFPGRATSKTLPPLKFDCSVQTDSFRLVPLCESARPCRCTSFIVVQRLWVPDSRNWFRTGGSKAYCRSNGRKSVL